MEYNIQEICNNGYKFKFFNGGYLDIENYQYITISDLKIYNNEIWGISITKNKNTAILFTDKGEFVFHYIPTTKKNNLSRYIEYNIEQRIRRG